MSVVIKKAEASDAGHIAELIADLLEEIIAGTGTKHFTIDREAMLKRCEEGIFSGLYRVLKAVTAGEIVGCICMSECFSLYTEGRFGIITELYVKPEFRSQRIGKRLLDEAAHYGKKQDWKRFEVNTPPLPEFQRSLSFYQKNGFEISGGKKLKFPL